LIDSTTRTSTLTRLHTKTLDVRNATTSIKRGRASLMEEPLLSVMVGALVESLYLYPCSI